MPALAHIAPEALSAYQATARLREQHRLQALQERREAAWQVARQAARLLITDHKATRVVVFGSLAHGLWFSNTSDIDLAVWGLGSEDYFTAVARLQDLWNEFGVDLVQSEHCRPELRKAIEEQGVLL